VYFFGSDTGTLIQHWNGATWEVVPSPSPSPHPDALEGVAVLSRAYAWTVQPSPN
jgi:hypothetical protein